MITAVGPQNLVEYDEAFLQQVANKINAILLDPVQAKNQMNGTDEDPYFFFVFPGHFSTPEKEAIAAAYHKAGWGFCIASNSEDNDELPGLCAVKLYKRLNSRHRLV